ncbi:maleylpyruvate isomerase family mycothiol-dependent enzyme [Pseudonocardia asaccharolytica]|uniref:Maleylpyruvate isomerase n=1 Tax=Pseudonocardia asaccharolytica DSM 44247 = NBRC 16224 TaxID=1123024 RepID=A0A511D2I4_9PSEU|nr:maleylpyruvate isomerase family mycothiol-dependent enzyme [Pseudonocardia asaccharolytica]GEL18980.1 maleylpyruvate isomerase [Pseudonocardia asaccharolytica DSM 44247 = NBRC 16224]
MSHTVAEALAWAADGAAHLRGLMVRLGDEAFAAPCALPGWSRAHLLTHIARNADAMINLLTWARTGTVTPAYASREQRDADIAAGARRSPAEIRDDVVETSDKLAKAVKAMPASAWSATVRNVAGQEVPASEIPWLRAREMWIHAVDLDVGASFADLPAPMMYDLLTEVTETLAQMPDAPAVRLIATDHDQEWSVGPAAGAVSVRGPVADLVGWALGRTRSRSLRADDSRPLPELPLWI